MYLAELKLDSTPIKAYVASVASQAPHLSRLRIIERSIHATYNDRLPQFL